MPSSLPEPAIPLQRTLLTTGRIGFSRLSLTLFCIAATACTGGDEKSESDWDLCAENGHPGGTWEAPCEDITALGDANLRGKRVKYVLNCLDDYEARIRYYLESTCNTVAAEITRSANYTIDSSNATADGFSKFDLQFVGSSGLCIYDATVAADFDSRDVCGADINWTNILTTTYCTNGNGRTCEYAPGDTIVNPILNGWDYDIINVDKTTNPNEMTFGDRATGNGSSTGTRPTALLPGEIFYLQ